MVCKLDRVKGWEYEIIGGPFLEKIRESLGGKGESQ